MRDRVSQIDAVVRGDRLLGFEDLCSLARLTTNNFDMFEELVGDVEASVLLGFFEEETKNLLGKDAAYKAEQLAAISCLKRVYEQARMWGVQPRDLRAYLSSAKVQVSQKSSDEIPQIYIMDQSGARRLGDESFDEVYLCDLDARYYPARSSHSALATLEKKIGCWQNISPTSQQRAQFEALKTRAQKRFVCERALNAGGEEDIYPAFVFDEFIECYRREGDELNAWGLPPRLQNAVVTRGEELFAANIVQEAPQQQPVLTLPALPACELDSQAQEVLFPHYSRASTYIQGLQSDTLVLSPSAIEAYVNCPYYWFTTQRIRPETFDEELGPLEKGTFVHSVWEEFYRRLFDEVGARRMTPGILSSAQGLLGSVFDECLQAQPDQLGVRYVPLSPTEQADAQRLKAQLQENLGLQARVMPSFVPTDTELTITAQENIGYAGVVVRGRVDRVDVDEQAQHYVVLDYKGSIAGHDAGCGAEDNIELPHKIQALIYAQVLRGQLGNCRPVGALYLSYLARDARDLMAGSYDQSMLAIGSFAKRASAVGFNFGTYLDRIEALVKQRINNLREGYIEPEPLCGDSCRYCPVVGCARRLS